MMVDKGGGSKPKIDCSALIVRIAKTSNSKLKKNNKTSTHPEKQNPTTDNRIQLEVGRKKWPHSFNFISIHRFRFTILVSCVCLTVSQSIQKEIYIFGS